MKFTTLMSGSAGNCVYIEGGSSKILVDIGCTMTYLKKALEKVFCRPEDISAVLVSHEHSDHIKGISAFCRKYDIPIFASPLTWEKLPFKDKILSKNQRNFEYGLVIGDIALDFIKLSHDACQPVGFIFTHNEQKLAMFTDTGKITPAMLSAIRNSDGLIIEANHNERMLKYGPYPTYLKKRISSDLGHLSNRQCAQGLLEAITDRTQAVLLAHLSETNNDPMLALQEVRAAFGERLSFDLYTAPNRSPHPLISLDQPCLSEEDAV